MTFLTYCVAFLRSINSLVEIDGILYSHCCYILWFSVGKAKCLFKKKLVGKAVYKNTNNISVLYWQNSRQNWKTFFLSCAWIEIVIQTGKITAFILFFALFFWFFLLFFKTCFLSHIRLHYYCPYKFLWLW